MDVRQAEWFVRLPRRFVSHLFKTELHYRFHILRSVSISASNSSVVSLAENEMVLSASDSCVVSLAENEMVLSASDSCVVSLAENEMVLSKKGCLFSSAFSSRLVFSSKGMLSKLRLKLGSYSSLNSEKIFTSTRHVFVNKRVWQEHQHLFAKSVS